MRLQVDEYTVEYNIYDRNGMDFNDCDVPIQANNGHVRLPKIQTEMPNVIPTTINTNNNDRNWFERVLYVFNEFFDGQPIQVPEKCKFLYILPEV